MPSPEDQGEKLKTPPTKSEKTTPYGSETATALPTPAPESLRQRYEVLGELGRGGMGIVYRARDRETDEVVALKVIHPQIAADPAIVERFKNELRLARKITHKNVCRMYELLRFEQTVVIAMEYVEGESLRAVLDRFGGVPLRRGLEWAGQMCAALAEAHGQGVIHRDLKPENILIDRLGQAKVMDFGIARSVESKATGTGGVIGTPAYMSPEQAEGKPLDARSDIYALGLMLYEMFTGRRTFEAETPAAIVHKHVYDTPPAPRSVEPLLPEFLEQAIVKCLEKKPEKRFQMIGEVRVALEGQAVPEMSPQGEPQPAPHLGVWGRRDWALVVLGVAGLFYFLAYRESAFPASKMRLEVDAISARRAAEEAAKQLGRTFSAGARSQMEVDTAEYQDTLFSRFDWNVKRKQDNLLAVLQETDVPIRWRIDFGPSPAPFEKFLGPASPGQYAVVDRKGHVQELSLRGFFEAVPPAYQPASTEARRDAAKRAAEQVCGPLPEKALMVETSGGERQAQYTASWTPSRPLLAPAAAEVSLMAEKVVNIRCHLPPSSYGLSAITGWLMQGASRLVLMLLMGGWIMHFGMGQCHRSPLLSGRMPVALALGFMGMWLLGPLMDQLPNTGAKGPPPSLYGLLVGGLALAVLLLVCMVAVEHYLARRFPGKIATYASLLRWRLGHPALGMAVVRGALLGLLMAGVETLTVRLTTASAGSPSSLVRISGLFTFGVVDPVALGQAMESVSPALFVLAASIFDGLVVGLMFLGGAWAIGLYKDLRKYQGKRFHEAQVLFSIVIVLASNLLAVRSHFAQVMGPGLGLYFALLIAAGLLVAAFAIYDVLTLAVAVGTAVLWALNYPLLQILSEVGNGAHWALFVAWGVLVAAGALLGFRSAATNAWHKMRQGFE